MLMNNHNVVYEEVWPSRSKEAMSKNLGVMYLYRNRISARNMISGLKIFDIQINFTFLLFCLELSQ